MALNSTFTEALMNLRRKAQLQGRPLTQAETSGVVQGMAESASDRLAKAKAADLKQQQVDINWQANRDAQLRNEQMLDIANKAMRGERIKNYVTTGLTAPKLVNESYKAGKELYGTVAPAIGKLFQSAPTVLQTQQVAQETPEVLKGLTDYLFGQSGIF